MKIITNYNPQLLLSFIKLDDLQQNIFDPCRKMWVKNRPEEYVRQLNVAYLIQILGISPSRISVERVIKVTQLKKRFDLVVYNKEGLPYFLFEIKSADYKISQSIFDQAARYNLCLKAPYLCISNGHCIVAANIDIPSDNIQFVEELPSYPF
ncbi:MAG: type I restriction enzyme HsdR N-terminal domain-containing protein [Bacteroidota bacterium]|nr:type I restriction enzyme HsdR N-terminal domain-containing protein [Bacteroidota bacterium]